MCISTTDTKLANLRPQNCANSQFSQFIKEQIAILPIFRSLNIFLVNNIYSIIGTGWLKSKLPFSKSYNSETQHFWPRVGKTKMHLRGSVFLKNCKQSAEKCKPIFDIWKNLPPLKHILALPTQGQRSLFIELQPVEKGIFNLGHPV